MKKLSAYITILRPHNAIMSVGAVILGYILAQTSPLLPNVFFLCVATFSAVGFGNVINDIADIATDRISHPTRPIPQGTISKTSALIYALILCCASMTAGLFVSPKTAIATAIPLLLLALYTKFLKGTPLAGNILVSILVAFPLVYGGLTSANSSILFIPATLAFLQNFCREIIKDIQDEKGDTAAGIVTSANLSPKTIHIILTVLSIIFLIIVTLPYVLHHTGFVYLLLCLMVVVPLHVLWFLTILKKGLKKSSPRVSALIKFEMLAGLCALILDNLVTKLV